MERLKLELMIATATLIKRSIAKIPFIMINGLRQEIAYDVAHKLPFYIINRIRGKNDGYGI